jgi:DNA-binding transcriptional ArsR family regulator
VVRLTAHDGLGVILFALSDPLRRRVLEAVAGRPGATVTEICEAFDVSRFAIMRHLNVLEESGLITRTPMGRERRVRLSDLRFDETISLWADGLRRRVE